MQFKKWLFCSVLLVLGVLAAMNVNAQEFYQNKTVRFVVGYSPGGGYDTYTRLIARHITKHIPGNPKAVVQNMPGAGSMLAANYIYQKTKPDGLTIGVWNNQLALLQALDTQTINFDSAQFGWVGAPVRGDPVCLFMGFSGIKTFSDALNAKKPIKMGATGTGIGATSYFIPTLFNKVSGATFQVVAGYKGSAKLNLALQSREVDGICLTWESVRFGSRAILDAEDDERLIPVVVQGNIPDPEVDGLPRIREFIQDEQKRAWYDAWVAIHRFQRPLTVPPDTPAERLNILREAFDSTMRDPEFLADAEKAKLAITPVSGTEAEQLIKTILAMPDNVKQGLRSLLEN